MVPGAPGSPNKISSSTYFHWLQPKHTETLQPRDKSNQQPCALRKVRSLDCYFYFLTLLCSTFLSLVFKKAQMILSLVLEIET